MLRLSKKSDYALISMKHLAVRPDASSSAREISEAYDIPLELLAKVLQRLVRARLLVSVQGTRGGYRAGAAGADRAYGEPNGVCASYWRGMILGS